MKKPRDASSDRPKGKLSKRKEFRRLSEVYPDATIITITEVMRKNKYILYKDIIQGDLGDCYFLCALCALCEFPEKIKKFFKENKIHEKGVIEVTLYIHGEPTKIVLDDYAPFVVYDDNDDDTKEPEPELCFAGYCKDNQNLWPVILEKAWAKLNIAYEKISKGMLSEAFEVLSPAPVVTLDHEKVNSEVIWQKTLEADDNKYLIAADISSEGKSKMFLQLLDKYGLVADHAYTVISVRYAY